MPVALGTVVKAPLLFLLVCQLLINASILSEVVRQLRSDKSNGFNSGTLSIEPFGGSRCRGVLATTYAFSMVFLGRRKSGKHSLQRNESPKILV